MKQRAGFAYPQAVVTVKSHPKLTSGTSDPDTCVASEIDSLPSSTHRGSLTENTSSQAGRELQSQAHTGAQYSTTPPQELPHCLMHLHSDLPGEGEISPATLWKALGDGGCGKTECHHYPHKKSIHSTCQHCSGSRGREAPGVVNNSICQAREGFKPRVHPTSASV